MLVAACSSPIDIDTLLDEARELTSNGELGKAVLHYKAALGEYPDRGDIRAALARVYLEGGDSTSAEKELKRAIQIGYRDDDFPLLLVRTYLMSGKNQAVVDNEPLRLLALDLESLPEETRATLIALRGHAQWALNDYEAAARSFDEAWQISPELDEALVGKALIALSNGDTAEARKLLNEALEYHPNSAVAWRNIAAIEGDEGNLEAAEAAYGKAIDAAVNNADDVFSRFVVRLRRHNLDAAKEDLERFRKINSREHLAHYGTGLLAFHEGQYESALTAFNEALSKAPNFVPAIAYLGFSNYLLQRWEQAVAALNRVNSLEPGSVEVNRALANALFRLGDFHGARAFAEEVIALQPNDRQALNILSSAALEMGDREFGLEILKRAVADEQQAPEEHVRYGLGLLSDGQFEQGFKELSRAIDDEPENGMALGILTFGYLQQGDVAKAIETAEKAKAALPDNPIGNNLLGGIRLSQQDLAAAKAAFEAALKVSPGDPSASHNLASIALVEGELAEAEKYYRGVLDAHPDHIRTYIKLSDIDLERGDVAAARTRLEQALALKPGDAEVSLALARIRIASGDNRAAIESLDALHRTYPGNVDVAATLARVNISEQNFDRSIEVLQRTLKNQPASALLFYLLGTSLAETGQLGAAKQAYQTVLRIGTRSIELQIDTIRSLLELRSLDVAEAALEAFEKIHGESVEGLTMRGLLELKRDNPQAAIAPLKSVLEGHPDVREAILLMARAESRSGDAAGSAKRLEEWLAKQPQDTQARYQLANVYLLLDESSDKAIETYKRVIEDEPNHGLALNNLASLLRDSDPKAALEYARRAAAAQPRSAAILDTLGSLQAQSGNTQGALETLQSAVNAAPLNHAIKLRLSRVQLQVGNKNAARENLREIVASGEDSDSVKEARDLLAKIDR